MLANRKLGKSSSILAALVVLVCAARGSAQGAPEAPDEATTEIGTDSRYAKLVADAVSAFDAGKFEASREMLRQAHAIRPNARTLRGMGLASFEMGSYALALVDLEAALAETRQPMSAEQREEVEKLRSEADALTARYAIEGMPQDAKLTVDEAPPVWDAAGLLVLEQGTHLLAVTSGVDIVRRYQVEARGGERSELDVSPPAAASIAQSAQSTSDAAPIRLAIEAPVHTWPRSGIPNVVAYAALGGAAVAGAIAIWQWRERESEVDAWNSRDCLRNRRTRLANCSEHQDAYETAETWAWIAAGTSLALAAGAVTLLVLNRRTEEKPEIAKTPVCVPGPGAFACRVSF
jgi:tetratricopeptide (TPR) repeat protein